MGKRHGAILMGAGGGIIMTPSYVFEFRVASTRAIRNCEKVVSICDDLLTRTRENEPENEKRIRGIQE